MLARDHIDNTCQLVVSSHVATILLTCDTGGLCAQTVFPAINRRGTRFDAATSFSNCIQGRC